MSQNRLIRCRAHFALKRQSGPESGPVRSWLSGETTETPSAVPFPLRQRYPDMLSRCHRVRRWHKRLQKTLRVRRWQKRVQKALRVRRWHKRHAELTTRQRLPSAPFEHQNPVSQRLRTGFWCSRGSKCNRCQANMECVRQTRPDSGRGIQVKVIEIFQIVPFLRGSGKKKK